MGHSLIVVGVPVAVMLLLTGIVVFERYAERAKDRKKDQQLKRWVAAHY